MIRVGMKHYINQEGDERVGGSVSLFGVLQQTKNDLAAIQNANDLIPGSPVAIDL